MMTQSWKNWWWTFAGIVGIGGVFAFCDTGAVAQITPDTTLGTENSIVTPNVDIRGLPADLIEGGATRGAALFHSFSEFNVGEGLRVYFANPGGIETIFSRVTGSDVSDILGTLGVDGGASLFLLNPNGIIFGENARLDIAGSFVASTANSVVFENGVEFSATNPEAPPILTINLTPGLQYGSNSNGRIANAGNLAVGAGETLSLYGNTVTSTGRLTAPGGTVQILGDRVGLFENAQIDVSSDMGGGTVLIGIAEEANNLYIPSVTHATRTFVSPDAIINANGIGNSDGGNVFIWSDEVTRFYGTISARGGETSGNGGFVEVSGQQYLDFNGQVDAIAPNGVMGTLLLDPTNIEVVAGFGETIDLTQVDAFDDPDIGGDGDTKLSAFALNFADANIILQATNNITVNESILTFKPDIGIRLEAGNNIILNQSITTTAGLVELVAGNDISLTSVGSGIFTDGAGVDLNAGGTIALSNGAVIDTSAFLFGVNSGDINIQTDSLLMTNGAQIIGNNAFGVGNPGNISVQANDAISLSEASGILSSVPTGATGNGGLIELNARSLSLTDGSQVQTLLFREQGGFPGGQGKAGTIQITATDFVNISGTSQNGFSSGLFASSERGANGAAGTITVTVDQGRFRVADGALVNTLTANSGDAGDITINAKTFEAVDGGQVLTLTRNQGNGGNLTVNATDSITIAGSDPTFSNRLETFGSDIVNNQGSISGLITDAAASVTGNAGNLVLNTRQLTVTDKARLSAATLGSGNGGDLIVKNAEIVEVSNEGVILTQVGNSITPPEIATGNGGELQINTEQLLLRNGRISTSTFGSGNSGNSTIKATDWIEVRDQGFLSSIVQANATGNGGNLTVETQRLTVENDGFISTSTAGRGRGGHISITATDSLEVIDSSLTTTSRGTQPGGDITITTKQLTLQNGEILNSNFSEGNAGNLTIQDAEFVHLNQNSVLSTRVNERATGNGGTLTIDTGQLIVEDNSEILTSTSGVGHAGDLTINATDLIQVSQESLLSAQVNETASGNGGNLTIDTGHLVLQDGGFISIGTLGQGRGGTLSINASESVDVIGGIESSGIFAGTLGFNAAGDLLITTRQLFVGNNATITTATSGMADAGNLTIHAWDSVDINGRGGINTNVGEGGQGMGGDLLLETGQLTVQNGGQIGAGTFDQGNAGTLTIHATDTIRLTGRSPDGSPSGLFTQSQGEGAAGGLRVITKDLIVQDGAAVSVSGFGSGNPGNLDIESQSIFLDQGRIEAGTTSGVGANIELQVQDNILMRNRSLINAQALNNGSGGNLDINADFVIAIPVENSDIIANAQEGSGGRIDITAQRIFGLQVRDPLTPLSDINASSEFGTDGEVVINQPDVDPNRGLLQLPTGLVDPTRLIDRSCNAGGAALASSFIVTGRGGIPPSPLDVLESDAIVNDWVTLDEETPTPTHPESVTPNSAEPQQIIEAQGWVRLANGQIVLVAESPTVTPQVNWQNVTDCEMPESK